MNPDEWAKIERLFDLAIELPSQQRAVWLDAVCAGQPERRDSLERLLRRYEEPTQDVREDSPLFAPGQLIAGRFLVSELIARGGMGEVYKVRDKKLHDLRLALKTIRPGIASEQAALQRFLREVWVPREISDEGICRMFELVEHRQLDLHGQEIVIPCLTMQFLDGEPLSTVLARRRPFPLPEALAIAASVGRSLQVLHDHGIIHRDLKPSNIMLVRKDDGSTRPVIIDFGLAKRLNADAAWETQTALLPGAPYFLAPEVFHGQRGSVASDVYSFGLLLDILVTQSYAFPYSSPEELLYRKLHEDPVPPSARAEALPPVWEKVILACLQRDPAHRPSRPADLVRLLEGDPTSDPLPAKPWRPSRRLWLSAAGATGVAAAAGAFSIFSPPSIEGSLLVFPFRNLTSRADFDQLCLGHETELIRRLRFFPKIQVFPVPRNWKPAQSDLAKGRLSLEASLQASAGAPAFLLRLLDNRTGAVASQWTLSASLDNPTALQNEIVERTVEALRRAYADSPLYSAVRSVLPAAHAALPALASTVNAALVEYQQGQQIALARTPAAALEAIACFERAIAHDPNFALAHAALADIRQVLLLFNRGATSKLLTEALQYAERAVALDAKLPECHVSLASARQNVWDWEQADHSYQSAIAVNPRFPRAHYWYGGLILQFGRMQEGLDRARLGLELDPFDHTQQATYGLYLWFAGRAALAASHLESLLNRTDIINAHINLGQSCAALARQTSEPDASRHFSRAITAAAEVRNREFAASGGIDPGYLKWSDLLFNQALASRGDFNAARFYAQRLLRGYEAGNISASAAAWAFAMINDRSTALDLLDQGLLAKEREMLYLRIHPLYRNLHPEKRFWKIARQMRLAEA